MRVDLYTEIPKMAIFTTKWGIDLYTGSTYTQQNTVRPVNMYGYDYFTLFIPAHLNN